MRQPGVDDRPVSLLQGAPGLLQERCPGRRELNVALGTKEQRDAHLGLQLFDLLAERRLGDVEPLGGPAEVKVLGHRDEILEMSKVQFARASYLRPINRV